MPTLKERLQEDVKTAMRAGERDRLGVLRMVMAAIKQREVDERTTLDDGQVQAVLEKMVKQRRESITQFEKGGRADRAAAEGAEIELLQQYLPEPLSDGELDALIDEIIAATGASGMRDMGRVMSEVRTRAQGRADMAAVGQRVKQRLS